MTKNTTTAKTTGKAVVAMTTVDDLDSAIEGDVLTPKSDGYDEARTVWNAMIDRRPSLIVRCRTAEDIRQSVRFAAQQRLLVAVKGGGHNIAGKGVCDGGMVIDLSLMRSISVDRVTRTVDVDPGVTLGELDAATQAHGLAVPTGINSTTGVAGLTLGGGFGWLGRKYGLTIDSLLSADVITAAGEKVKASTDENPDLFWGIRGGGGNFGIISKFRFKAHPFGPNLLCGLIIHPFHDADKLLRFYRDFTSRAPDDLTVWVVMRKCPPLPFVPEQWHGKEVLVFPVVYTGDVQDGAQVLKPLREFGSPIVDGIGVSPFVGFQSAFDPLLTPGLRNYWKSHDFQELTDGAISTLIRFVTKLPSPNCEVFIGQMGGATASVPADATAFRDRSMRFTMNVHGRWETSAEDGSCIKWCRSLFDSMTPYANGGVYVNFMTEDEADRVPSAYGASYSRLVELKRKYDPTNLFRMNQNIRPH